MKTFYNVVNSIICCAKETLSSIIQNIEWVQFVLQNCETCIPAFYLQSVWQKQWFIVLFTSDLMYKKYKRLVYMPPDLLARFCTVNMSNTKNLAWFCFPRICFPGLIYCDQEPLWLMLSKMIAIFGGTYIRLLLI